MAKNGVVDNVVELVRNLLEIVVLVSMIRKATESKAKYKLIKDKVLQKRKCLFMVYYVYGMG
jgi:hypothetical protein